jgi:tetratricopeptide (TPR) repeat protein
MLAYHEGNWERSKLLLRKDFDRARDAGRIREIAHWGSLLGRIARIDNQRVEAEAILDEALRASLTCPDLNRELFIRIELALIDADFGRIPRAKEELRRCKEILDNGEDWCGHNGAYEHVSALVKAAEQILKFASSDRRWHVPLERQPTRLPEEVADGFRAAIDIFRHYHAPWEESAAILYWSQALFATSQIRQSIEKFIAAFTIFDRIATPRWNERIQTELFRFITWDTLSKPLTVGDGTGSNIFRNEGDYWTISFGGSMFRLRDTIGMHYISRLLANPAMNFTAQDLVDIAQKTKPKRSRSRNSRAALINGRRKSNRHDGDDLARERARLMVTKRIKDVIARIRRSNPELARHLATSIRTGYVCCYAKDDAHPVSWMI